MEQQLFGIMLDAVAEGSDKHRSGIALKFQGHRKSHRSIHLLEIIYFFFFKKVFIEL